MINDALGSNMMDDARALSNRWSEIMTAATRNLVDFSSSEICHFVKARLRADHPKVYKGLTAMRGNAAKSELDNLLQDYLPLARVVEQAQSLISRNNFLVNHDKEAIELLTGRSVKMNTQGIQTNNSSRDLLSGARADEYCTPAQALESMQKRFAAAYDSFVAIHEAENRFQASLNSLNAQKAALTARAQSLGLSVITASEIEEMSLDIDPSDPLSSQDAIEVAQKKLKSLESDIEYQSEQAQKVSTIMTEISRDLIALRSECARNTMNINQTIEIFGSFNPPPMEATTHEAIAFLEKWKIKLDATLSEGKFQACLVGAAKLKAAISDQKDLTARALNCNKKFINELEDMRGRFEAFSAKARAIKAQGIGLSIAVLRLEEACENALKERPPSLEKVKRLVGSYEESIVALRF